MTGIIVTDKWEDAELKHGYMIDNQSLLQMADQFSRYLYSEMFPFEEEENVDVDATNGETGTASETDDTNAEDEVTSETEEVEDQRPAYPLYPSDVSAIMMLSLQKSITDGIFDPIEALEMVILEDDRQNWPPNDKLKIAPPRDILVPLTDKIQDTDDERILPLATGYLAGYILHCTKHDLYKDYRPEEYLPIEALGKLLQSLSKIPQYQTQVTELADGLTRYFIGDGENDLGDLQYLRPIAPFTSKDGEARANLQKHAALQGAILKFEM